MARDWTQQEFDIKDGESYIHKVSDDFKNGSIYEYPEDESSLILSEYPMYPEYFYINFKDGTTAKYQLEQNDGALQDFFDRCQNQGAYENLLKECYEQLSYVNRDLNFFLSKSKENDLQELLKKIEKSLDKSFLNGYNKTIDK